MMHKKAQLTLFIIVGIVIVMAVGLLAYFKVIVGKQVITPEVEPGAELAYKGQSELKQFIDSCLKPITLEGLEIIRLQAGYIDIPSGRETLAVKDWEGKTVKANPDGTKDVVIDPNGANQVPYWLTEDEFLAPSLPSIENELKKYIDRELAACVGDFNEFKKQGFKVEKGKINSTVEMEEAVVVTLDFPVKLLKGDVVFEMSQFIVEVPINMRLVYNMAYDLTNYENIFAYFEKHTKQLIDLYSYQGGAKEDSIPPFVHPGDPSCFYVEWLKDPEVKERLKDILELNTQYLKINNTNFTRVVVSDPQQQGVYDSFIYPLFSSKFPTLHIDFSYDGSWDFNAYEIEPNLGNILRPDRHSQTNIPMLPMFCVFRYAFKYSLQYPVLVKVKEDSSAKIDPASNVFEIEKGYSFQFPMRTFLCGNQERLCTGANVMPGIPELNLSAEDANAAANLPTSYFCEENQRLSDNITVKTYDMITNLPVDSADVYYYCGSQQNDCWIGRTNENAELKTSFPYCENGQLYFLRQNYTEKRDLGFTVRPNEGERSYSSYLEPFRKLNATVIKMHLPTFVRNYYETNGFSNISEILAAANRSGYDMTAITQKAESLDLDITKAPSVFTTYRRNPATYCDKIAAKSYALGIPPDSYSEPVDNDPLLYGIQCGIGSYTKTENAIVNTLLGWLKNSDEYKLFYQQAMDSFLTGREPLSQLEFASITLYGPESITFMQPPSNTTSLVSGDYSSIIFLSGNVTIQDTTYSSGDDSYTVDGFSGPYQFGSASLTWNIDRTLLHNSNHVVFYALSNFKSDELNPGDWRDIDDPILQDNGILAAELLYEAPGTGAGTGVVCGNYSFVSIDGLYQSDYSTSSLYCTKAVSITLNPADYLQFITPRLERK